MPPVTPSPFRFVTRPSQKPKPPDPTTSNPTSSPIALHLPSPPPAPASTPTPTPKPTATPKPQFAPAKRFHIPTPRALFAPTPPPPPPPPLPPPITQPSRAQTPNSASPPFLRTTRRFHIPPPAPASTPAPTRAHFNYAPSGSNSSTQPTTPAPLRTTLLFKKSYQRDSIDADIHSEEEPTSPLQKKRKLHPGGEDIEAASSPPPSPHGSDTEEFQVEKSRNRFLFTPTTTAVATQGHTIINYHRSIRPPPGGGAAGGGGRGGEEAIPLDWSPAKTRAAKRWAAGGLAAEVAGWVLEKGSLGAQVGGGGRIVVAGVKSGDGVFVVRGEGEGEGGFLLPIVGGGGVGGGLAVGSLVVYGLPWWEVLVGGVGFKFLVAWRVEVREEEREEVR